MFKLAPVAEETHLSHPLLETPKTGYVARSTYVMNFMKEATMPTLSAKVQKICSNRF